MQYTSTVERASVTLVMNSREFILNLPKKKTKVNSKCQCHIKNCVRCRVINSDEQSQMCSSASNLLLVEGYLYSSMYVLMLAVVEACSLSAVVEACSLSDMGKSWVHPHLYTRTCPDS